jgi:hypothetical protein
MYEHIEEKGEKGQMKDCHYEKRGCFPIGLATQFLSYIGHLQLTIFIHCEC